MIVVHVDKLKNCLGEAPKSWLKVVDCPTPTKIDERVIELITSDKTLPIDVVPSSLETVEPVINNEVELEKTQSVSYNSSGRLMVRPYRQHKRPARYRE